MKIGKTKVDIFSGALSKTGAQALIVPANDMLWFGGGLTGDIRNAGGREIENEAMKHAPAEIGSAIVTGAGTLDAKCIIHAIIGGQDLSTDEKSIRRAVLAALKLAEERKCESVAVPLLDSGHFDVEIHIAARIIVDETVEYLLSSHSELTHVILVEHDATTKGMLEGALLDKFTKHG